MYMQWRVVVDGIFFLLLGVFQILIFKTCSENRKLFSTINYPCNILHIAEFYCFFFGLQVNNATFKFLIPVNLQCGIGFKNLFPVMFIFKVSKCILNNKKILLFILNTVSQWQFSLNFSSISSTGTKCTCNWSNGTEK